MFLSQDDCWKVLRLRDISRSMNMSLTDCLILAALLSPPISWRVRNEKSLWKSVRVRISLEKGTVSFDKFIELRVTSLTFLILLQRSVISWKRKKKYLRLYICYFFAPSLSEQSCQLFFACLQKLPSLSWQVSTPPFSSRTFQIPCPGRSLVFYTFLLSLVSQSPFADPIDSWWQSRASLSIKKKDGKRDLSFLERYFSVIAEAIFATCERGRQNLGSRHQDFDRRRGAL